MKQLHEYETPETDNAEKIYDYKEGMAVFARDLERRLAMCRDVLGALHKELRDRYLGRMPEEVQVAYNNAREALAATEPKP